MVDATVTKRLHVGGLIPTITSSHIKDRFASFGTVQEVEEMQPDAFGQPRSFTFLTIETTPNQLKRCLNILSGSFWRGTQLRLAEAKPRHTAFYAIPEMTVQEKQELLVKKRKRVEHARGEGVGKQAQDMRVVTPKIGAKKKFWVEDQGRLVRPVAMRPSHPIGVLADRERSSTRRLQLRAPPTRSRRRVIDPLKWGSTYLAGDKLQAGSLGEKEDGDWEYEEIEEEDEEAVAEDGKVAIGIWRRIVDGEVVEEEVVRAKKKKVSQEDDYEYDFDDISLPDNTGDASSPLFGTRNLPADNGDEREASPLFATRALGAPSPSSPISGVNVEDDQPVSTSIAEQPSSPLFPSRPVGSEEKERSASPLFPVRSIEDMTEQAENSPSEAGAQSDAASGSSSPLFPSRAALATVPSPALAPARSPSPIVASKPSLPKTKVVVPAPILASTRAERSSALSVLGALLGDLSPPREKRGKEEWAGFAESSDEDDDADEEVEVARGRSRSAAPSAPSARLDAGNFAGISSGEQAPDMDIPVEEEAVDAPASGTSGTTSESSSSSGSDSGSSSSSGSEQGGMDVDPPAGGEGAEASGSGSSSSSSGSGSESGDDDDEDSSEDSSSNSDSDSDSDDSSDSEDDSDDEGTGAKAEDREANKAATAAVEASKPAGLKDMFASGPSSSLFGDNAAGGSGGFSLLANLDPDLELDEDLDITIPTQVPSAGGVQSATIGREEEPELLPLISSSRGKVKFDADPSIPLFFALPTSDPGPSSTVSTRKGESKNPYNELYTGVPIPRFLSQEQSQSAQFGRSQAHGAGGHYGGQYRQHGYGQGQGEDTEMYEGDEGAEEEEEVQTRPLPAFVRQPGETDETMRAKWEAEKVELTQAWRKRSREAKKQRRRKGGEDVE